jgi:hypothetical protein
VTDGIIRLEKDFPAKKDLRPSMTGTGEDSHTVPWLEEDLEKK